MIEVEDTDVNIVRNLIPMRNHMPASAYGLKAISDWFFFFDDHILQKRTILLCPQVHLFIVWERRKGGLSQPSWHCPNFIAVFIT